MTLTKEIAVEEAIKESLPRTKDAIFEIDYSKFVATLYKAPLIVKAQIIKDILGDVSNTWPLNTVELLLDTYIIGNQNERLPE